METRIKNLVTYDGMDRKAAEERIKDADRQSDGFMKELASRINVKYYKDEFDLGICTDRIGIDEAASIILHAFELFQKSIRMQVDAFVQKKPGSHARLFFFAQLDFSYFSILYSAYR